METDPNTAMAAIVAESVYAQPAKPITTVDETHPSNRKEIEMMISLKEKLIPWANICNPMDPANSCRELAETAVKGLDGVLDKFRGVDNYPDIHLPMNWPKAATASIRLARRTIIVLEATNVTP